MSVPCQEQTYNLDQWIPCISYSMYQRLRLSTLEKLQHLVVVFYFRIDSEISCLISFQEDKSKMMQDYESF